MCPICGKFHILIFSFSLFFPLGSGKTLSFGIPVIHNILEWKSASESWKLSQAAGASDTDTTPQEGGAVAPATGDAAAAGDEAEERESLESSATEKVPPEASEHTPSVRVTEPADDGAVEEEEDAKSKEEDVEENNLSRDDEEEEEEGVEEDEDELDEGSDGDSEDEGDDDDERGCVQITETDVDKSDVQGSDKQPLLALILTPTRELAVQVKHHIDAIAQFTGT